MVRSGPVRSGPVRSGPVRSAAFVPTACVWTNRQSSEAGLISRSCSLSIYFAPTCFSMGELSRIETGAMTTILTIASVRCIGPLAFVPTVEYGQTDTGARRVLSRCSCSLSIYFAPTCLSMGELSRIEETQTPIYRFDVVVNDYKIENPN